MRTVENIVSESCKYRSKKKTDFPVTSTFQGVHKDEIVENRRSIYTLILIINISRFDILDSIVEQL